MSVRAAAAARCRSFAGGKIACAGRRREVRRDPEPNTYSRSGLLMLPVGAASLAFIAFRGPELPLTRILSIVPPFSASVLPARMLLDRVPAWEVALAIVLLTGAVWILRRLAGKVFHLGMLMYGKEPSWGEVRRWMRET
jgi:ABC-2 type transport system permease protein